MKLDPAFFQRGEVDSGQWIVDSKSSSPEPLSTSHHPRATDFRLSADGTPYFLEANPNPEIAESQEFATAAKHVGVSYPDLLQRIVSLAMRRGTAGAAAA